MWFLMGKRIIKSFNYLFQADLIETLSNVSDCILAVINNVLRVVYANPFKFEKGHEGTVASIIFFIVLYTIYFIWQGTLNFCHFLHFNCHRFLLLLLYCIICCVLSAIQLKLLFFFLVVISNFVLVLVIFLAVFFSH